MGAIRRKDIITEDAIKAPLDLSENLSLADKSADQLLKTLKKIVESGKASDTNLDLAKSTKQVNEEVKTLTTSQKELERIDKRIATEQARQNKEYIQKQKQLKDIRNETKRLVTEEEKLVGTEEKLIKRNKELREERKKLDLETSKGAARAKEINEELNKNNEFLKENSSSLEQNRFQVGGYREALEGLGVQVENLAGNKGGIVAFFKSMVGGINQATRAGLRFIATPIGAVIAALVATIAALSAVINSNQAASDEFNRIWSGISNVISEVTSRVILLAKAYLKFITLDFKGAIKDASAAFDDLANALTKAYEEGTKLFDLQVELERAQIAATTATARLRNEIEQLGIIEGDATRSFKERENAARLSRQRQIELSQTELDLARKSLEMINIQVAAADRRGDKFRELEQQQADAAAVVIEAEGALISSQLENEKILRELKQDRLERDLDILIDGFDNVKTINEKIINDDKRTVRNREENFERLRKLSDDSFAQQIKTIEQFTNVSINANDLIATSDAKVLNDRIRSLGLSEIIEGRLLEVVRERRLVESDFAELQAGLDDARIARLNEIAGNERTTIQERINALLDLGVVQMEVLDRQLKQGAVNAQEYGEQYIKIQEETARRIAELNLDRFDKDATNAEFDLRAQELDELRTLNEQFRNGEIQSIEQFEDQKLRIEQAAKRRRLNAELDFLEDRLGLLQKAGIDTSEIESQISAVRLELSEITADKLIENEKQLHEEIKKLKGAVLSSGLQIIDNINEAANIQREEQLSALEEQKNQELSLIQEAQQKEGESDEAFALRQQAILERRATIEEDYAQRSEAIKRRQKEQQRRQAIFEKTLAITEVAINTAVAIAKAVKDSPWTFGLPASAIAAAIGAVQIAAIATKPIPSFEKGTGFAPSGLAIVNEQGPELITDKHGNRRIIGTDGPTLTYLQGGERIDTFSNTKKLLSENEEFTRITESAKMDTFVREIRRGFTYLTKAVNKQTRPVNPDQIEKIMRRGETWLGILKDFK